MNFTPLRGEFELTDVFVDLCNNMTLMNAFVYGLSFSSALRAWREVAVFSAVVNRVTKKKCSSKIRYFAKRSTQVQVKILAKVTP